MQVQDGPAEVVGYFPPGTIDCSIDCIDFVDFSHFCSGSGEDMPTRVPQYAEHEYDNRFGWGYRFIDFINFFSLLLRDWRGHAY
ncbi:hypothetical protein Y032_0002g566 [Ancylostoma ceylanicum]|uniref:Uncharacterized protein n=1 Tax=Ancylostoma ceylanicum TaxID=53326 RepID=A0A016VZP7_9BILA|nr:hypothetical protein Y032_0002g566 [Ancylostoma ceylanicum]